MSKPKILIFYEFFPPAIKSGGITRSLINLSQSLKSEYEFYVFAGNRDSGDIFDLPVEANTWTINSEGIHIYYSDLKKLSFAQIQEVLRSINPDIVYMNGIFNPKFSLFPLWFRKITKSQAKWVIAPRGMLQVGALKNGKLKKSLYLKIWKALSLTENITWHATDPMEIEDVMNNVDKHAEILIANNIPAQNFNPVLSLPKEKGKLKLVYLSLISEKKNLLKTLEIIHSLSDEVDITFDIYGPIKDPEYWQKCTSLLNTVKSNLTITYKGEVNPAETGNIFIDYHFFFLLTEGENFGHSIFEALHAGTPVLISDNTPWRKLASVQAGWDLDLSSPELIAAKIQEIAAMSAEEYMPWREGARQMADDFIQKTDFTAQYQRLFSLHDKNENDKTYEIQ